MTPPWYSHAHKIFHMSALYRVLRKSLGLAPTNEIRVLAEMFVALKAASEIALQTQIKAVAVTAPWIAAWHDQVPYNCVISDALSFAGLESWSYPWEDEQIYLGEINTALASEGRWICPKSQCMGHWMDVEGEVTNGGPIFVVRFVILRQIPELLTMKSSRVDLYSFTNRSLYTSFQDSHCYFSPSLSNHLASINPRYGLDQVSRMESQAQFWSGLKSHLISLVRKDRARDSKGRYQLPLTIIVMGEAADSPAFLDIVHGVAQDVQQLCIRNPEDVGCKEKGAREAVELMILDDPTYGPAKGAAFWLWAVRSRYCADINDAQGILDQYEMAKKHPHEEL